MLARRILKALGVYTSTSQHTRRTTPNPAATSAFPIPPRVSRAGAYDGDHAIDALTRSDGDALALGPRFERSPEPIDIRLVVILAKRHRKRGREG